MSKIFQSIAVMILALAGLAGCGYESHAAGDANPDRVAEMKQSFRDLWLGHIYWVQHAVLNNETNTLAKRAAVKKEIDDNTKQIASTIAPFYGRSHHRDF